MARTNVAWTNWQASYFLIHIYKLSCIYVYIIRSINHLDQVYVGHTTDLKKRLSNHNCGTTEHTAKYKPWELVMYLAFSTEIKAIEFEKYLKSHSGRAFRQKRLI